MVSIQCKECRHKKVCKYVTEFEAAQYKFADLIDNPPIEMKITCGNFDVEPVNWRQLAGPATR